MFEDPSSAGSTSRAIRFSDRDTQDAARLLSLIAGEQPFTGRRAPLDPPAVARAIMEDRNQRAQMFNAGMFGEPAWDILLTLYGTENSGMRLTIGQVLLATGCPSTTGHRWLEYLEGAKLIERIPHPGDSRTCFLAVTDKARNALAGYLSQLRVTRF